MRRLLAAMSIFLALGPVPGTVQHFYRADLLSQAVTARPLDFRAAGTGMLRFVRGWRLTSPHSMFGGFSALALVGPDQFLLLADNGYWARLALAPDGTVAACRIGALPTPAGGRARAKSQSDTEALVVDPASGTAWVALEGVNQIWRLDRALGRIESRAALPRPAWPANRGPEAMVRLGDGRTIIFSEDAHDHPRGREAFVFAGDPAVPGARATRFLYDAEGKGLVSDAALLPDGRILLLHRKLGLSPIFTTILAIVDPAAIMPGGVVRSVAIGQVPAPLADNYEGMATERRGDRTFVWLASDDNFNGWQRSLLVQFELVGLPPRGDRLGADSKKAAR